MTEFEELDPDLFDEDFDDEDLEDFDLDEEDLEDLEDLVVEDEEIESNQRHRAQHKHLRPRLETDEGAIVIWERAFCYLREHSQVSTSQSPSESDQPTVPLP